MNLTERKRQPHTGGCRRRWPLGLQMKLRRSGFILRRRPVIGVARSLMVWAHPETLGRTLYLWRIEPTRQRPQTAERSEQD